jgi:hypothetical protein
MIQDHDLLDGDGYPHQAVLDYLQAGQDPTEALDLIRRAWHWPEFTTEVLTAGEASVVRAEKGERYLRLATGGWRGNESLISALAQNRLVWMTTWQLSASGGLHIFKYP